jgi:Sugar (and other) transporter
MVLGLLTLRESPRWLASQGRSGDALSNLAYLRRSTSNSEEVCHELAEIEAAIVEEREAHANFGLREAILGRGNFIRFLIAFFIFFLQQWCGQNSVSYYAPQIFTSVSMSPVSSSFNLDIARSGTRAQRILSSQPAFTA